MMKLTQLLNHSRTLLVALALVSLPAWAQTGTPTTTPPGFFHNLKFRNLGPAIAGGRVTSVVGIPGNPKIYYVGAAGGGVWKSVDGGLHWKAIFTHADTSSISNIALAPSNPNLVWVATGEANIRNDVLDGGGLYLSTDAGKTWKLMGFKDAGQIAKVVVDPQNSDTVWVAVLGHAWGPNPERGVFKTIDGGKTWKKVLFVNDHTGAIDLT
ncbi:MAG: WD40/YVTN/BNR-like repeat-containing protein, partial [Gammaproteobacteria bacterium]